LFVFYQQHISQGGLLMKRFLGVLVASMFLASAAYAGEAMKEEKKADAKTTEKKSDMKAADTKGSAKAADTKSGAKAAGTKGGAMGEKMKSETAKDKTADKPAAK
jgi:hypothetical protein